jgi:hypothetical protein
MLAALILLATAIAAVPLAAALAGAVGEQSARY